jgi:hypothetical protein
MDEGVEHDDSELLSFAMVDSSSDIIEYLEIFIWVVDHSWVFDYSWVFDHSWIVDYSSEIVDNTWVVVHS